MAYKILLYPKANKFLEKNETAIRERIKNKLRILKNFPDRKGNHQTEKEIILDIHNSGSLG